jgi:DUF971 family protein
MADVFHRPTDWGIVPERRVFQVTWDDGQVTEYGFEEMRRACPCAYCAGEGGVRGTVDARTRFSEEQTTMKEVHPVGRYGLSPVWGDDHDTGIYTFKTLRRAAGLE